MNKGVFEEKFVYSKFDPSLVGKKVFWADTNLLIGLNGITIIIVVN